MKKSAVNPHLFVRDIKRSWPIWVGMCYIYISTYFPRLLSESYAYETRFTLGNLSVFIPVADFLLVLLVFGFMNNSRSANFFFSLPIKRGSLFLTKTLACLVVTFIPAILAGIVPIIAHPGDPVPVYLFAQILLAHVTFLGTALFCMVIIGQSIAFAAISAIFQFTAYGIYYMLSSILSASIYGFYGSFGMGRIVQYLTPVWYFTQSAFYNDPYNIYYTVADVTHNRNNDILLFSALMALGGLALGIIAFFAFKKRKAESAGDIVVFKFLQPIFKYCVAFCSSLLFTRLMLSALNFTNDVITHRNLPLVCLMLIVNTALGYFITEMLIQKKFNVFKRTWKGCAVIATLIVAAMCFVEFDVLGIETDIPDIDSITSVHVLGTNGATYEELSDIENAIALHQYLLAHKDEIETSKIDFYNSETVRVSTGDGNTSPVGEERNRIEHYKYENDAIAWEYFQNFFGARYPNSIQIYYNLEDGKVLSRSYISSRLYGDETATLELGEMYYKLAHTYAYAQDQQFRSNIDELDGSDITVSIVCGDTTKKLDKSLVNDLYYAIQADMRDLNIVVDELAPRATARPETLMEDRIEFTLRRKNEEQHGGSYAATDRAYTEYTWGSVTLDTRAKNTLAVLEREGIAVD